jgi:hypothetical protein
MLTRKLQWLSVLSCLLMMGGVARAQVAVPTVNSTTQITDPVQGRLDSALSGLNTAVTKRQYINPPQWPGVYQPSFQNASGLSNISGTFAVASGGGLIASVSGTTASGNINLPVIIDSSKQFRIAFLVQYGGSAGDGKSLNVSIANPANAQSAVKFVIGANLTIDYGFSQAGQTTWPAGTTPQKYWLTVTGDGGMGGATPLVSIAVIPIAHSGLYYTGYADSSSEQINAIPYNQQYSGVQALNGLSQIQISTQSTSNVLLGVWASIGGLQGAPDPRMQPPALMRTSINGDNQVYIRVPETYTGTGTTDMIVSSHGNASFSLQGQASVGGDGGAAFATLAANGYLILACQNGNDYNQVLTVGAAGATNGATSIPVAALTSPVPAGTALTWNNGTSAVTTLTQTAYVGATSLTVNGTWGGSGNLTSGNTATYTASGIYSGPLSSNWGAPGPLVSFELNNIAVVKNNFPGIRNTYKVGQSMGLLNSLMEVSYQPSVYKAVYGIDGVTNLSDCYTNSGFSGIINPAYPTYYVCIQANTGQAVTATAYWQPITPIGGYPSATYQAAPYVVRGAYSGATAYAVNDVVFANATTLTQVADHDPQLRPALYTSIPMRFVVASGDTTISPTANAALFSTTVNALGGSTSVLTVTGGHLAAPSYSGSDMLAFFQAHQ